MSVYEGRYTTACCIARTRLVCLHAVADLTDIWDLSCGVLMLGITAWQSEFQWAKASGDDLECIAGAKISCLRVHKNVTDNNVRHLSGQLTLNPKPYIQASTAAETVPIQLKTRQLHT